MRTKKTVVILVSGKAGSGKDTVGDILKSKLRDIKDIEVMLYGFANPIKFIAQAYGGWDKKKDERGRKLLQQIGGVFREYDADIWAKHFINQLDKFPGLFPPNFVIISDWRFPNELNFLKNNPLLDIVTIRVFGRGGLEGETASDVSENSLPEATKEHLQAASYEEFEPYLYYDFCIENSGDIELLNHKLEVVLAEIQKQFILE